MVLKVVGEKLLAVRLCVELDLTDVGVTAVNEVIVPLLLPATASLALFSGIARRRTKIAHLIRRRSEAMMMKVLGIPDVGALSVLLDRD